MIHQHSRERVARKCEGPGEGERKALISAGAGAGLAAHAVAPAWASHPEIFAVLGMGALLTSIVRAPLTGIVLMIELTGKYDFMLPLLVSCFAAYGVAEALRDVPIYEALRERAEKRSAGLCASEGSL